MVNSIINDSVKSNIECLDSYTTVLLQHIDELELDYLQHNPSIEANLSILKESFYKTFNLAQNVLSKSQFKSKDVAVDQSKLSLANLADNLKPFEAGLISTKIYEDESFKSLDPSKRDDIKIVCKLEKSILIYNLLLLYIVISNRLLKKTIPLSNDIEYFDDLLSSKISFGVYCLQNSPLTLYQLGNDVYQDLFNFATPRSNISAPSWLPSNYHNVYAKLINFKNLLFAATFNNLHKVVSPNFFLVKNFQKSPPRLSYISAVLGTPFFSARQSILTKKQNLISLKHANAEKLGLMLNELPNFQKYTPPEDEINITKSTDFLDNENLFESINETVDKLVTSFEGGDPLEVDSSYSDFNTSFIKLNKLINQLIPIHAEQTRMAISLNTKPSKWIRYWIVMLFGIVYVPTTATTLIGKQAEIKQWIQSNLIDSIKGFYKNWILKPMNQILATVRHDSSSEIAIMSQKSMSSDLESLTRMAIDLAIDNSSSLSASELENLKTEISHSIQAGDLTTIMLNYEHVLKNPVSNLLKGKLLRSLLIQIQKLKVDGDVAMNGIDKLLKSQELVFTVVAASPSLLVIYYILSSLNAYYKNGSTRFNSSLKPRIYSNLNNIERLLTISEGAFKDYQTNGLILLEVIELRSLGLLVLPKSKKAEWIRDCNDILDNDFDTNTKLKTISRIWRVYSNYL